MPEILATLTLALTLSYILLVGVLCIGLFRPATQSNTTLNTISVLIPARNEASNISACLQALAKQTYPRDKIEIILINDRSTDQTRQIAQSQPIQNLKVVEVTEQKYQCPKKNALDLGISCSKNDLILTTDADCRPPPHWIASTVRCFGPEMGMVMGLAPLIPQPGLLNHLFGIQSLVVAALSAGSAGVGYPLTCTGRNLAYRREAFTCVNGFEGVGHLLGGDDVYLMQKIAKTPYKIGFNQDQQAAVPSNVHPDRQFTRQIRYQSKTPHYGFAVLLPALAVYIFHLILFLVPFGIWPTEQHVDTLVFCFMAKTVCDATFLTLAAARFADFRQLIWFPLLELLLYPYIVIVCALGALIPSKWK